MALEILNKIVTEGNGLLSKINIGNKVYELKDVVARETIEQIAADLAAISHIEYTDVFESDVKIKEYVDAQVGAINKFDVVIGVAGDDGKPNVVASADTMYKLYLIQNADSSAGEYIEFITIRSGVEGAYEYKWEAIGSTKMSLTGYVTETALAEALKPYEKISNLKALAYKDSATGAVAGQTISGVKASGTSTGSINVALTEGEEVIASTGSYTPAGSVNGGTVTAAGDVAITVTNTDAQAVLARGDYQPAGTVAVSLANAEINAVKSVGTQASFTEGTFTPASLTKEDVTANYAKEGIVGAVEGETLTFTAAGIEAITATKVTAFNGGSKAADTFVTNELPVAEKQTVGVASSTFEGAVESGLKVTGVTYEKHDSASATFTGTAVDVVGASFSGSAATISVSGNGKTYAVDTDNTKFNGAAIELAVGDIVVTEKNVTVQ